MKLKQVQSEFSKAIIHGLSPTPDSGLTESRLNIYANSVEAIHINALSIIFPVFKKFTGDSFFNRIVMDFLKHNTYEFKSLEKIGKDFIAATNNNEALNNYFFYQDLMRLENCIHNLQFAYSDENRPVSQSELSEKSPDNLRFTNRQNVELISIDKNATSIWDAHQQETVDTLSTDTPETSYYLIEKLDSEVSINELDKDIFLASQQLFDGANFERLCEIHGVEIASQSLTMALQKNHLSILN